MNVWEIANTLQSIWVACTTKERNLSVMQLFAIGQCTQLAGNLLDSGYFSK